MYASSGSSDEYPGVSHRGRRGQQLKLQVLRSEAQAAATAALSAALAKVCHPCVRLLVIDTIELFEIGHQSGCSPAVLALQNLRSAKSFCDQTDREEEMVQTRLAHGHCTDIENFGRANQIEDNDLECNPAAQRDALLEAEKHVRDVVTIQLQLRIPLGDKDAYDEALKAAFGALELSHEEYSKLMNSYFKVIGKSFPEAFQSHNQRRGRPRTRRDKREEETLQPNAQESDAEVAWHGQRKHDWAATLVADEPVLTEDPTDGGLQCP